MMHDLVLAIGYLLYRCVDVSTYTSEKAKESDLPVGELVGFTKGQEPRIFNRVQ
jgi:hypothetical protein